MKRLVIFFEGNYKQEYENNAFFNMPELTQNSFLDFFDEFVDDDIEIYICRGSDTYLNENNFSQGFLYNKFEKNFRLVKDRISADFIFNRSAYNIKNAVNDYNLIIFTKNKLHIYQSLPEICPKTQVITNKNNLLEELNKQKENKKIVLKTLDGSCGNNVLISKDKKELSDFDIFPCLMQEYLDTSLGIPNIYHGKHDLRIMIINGEIVYSLFRTPGEGSDISNLSKGGTFHNVNIDDLPLDVYEIVQKVEKILDKYSPRFYSIDVGFTQNGIKIFELNSSPAIYTKNHKAELLHKKLYQLIKNNIYS